MKDEATQVKPLIEVVESGIEASASQAAGEQEARSDDTEAAEETTGEQESLGLSSLGKALVGVSIALWLGIFLGGILVDTRPFRKAISPAGLESAIGEKAAVDVVAYGGPKLAAVVGVYLFYTPTNLAMLTLLAGLLGTLGRKASLHSDPNGKQEDDRINPKLSALLRSFLVYLFFLSGVLFFADEPFSSPSPASYLRLAGIISLFSFVANYTPSIFSAVLEDAHNYIRSKRQRSGKEERA